MKILLIEDDESLSNYIKKGLKEHGHIIDAFSDGSEGLEAAYLEEHDIILLDRMLPSIDGLTIVNVLLSILVIINKPVIPTPKVATYSAINPLSSTRWNQTPPITSIVLISLFLRS